MKSLPAAPHTRLSTWLLALALLVLVVASFATLPLQWRALLTLDAARSTLEFLHGFLPPDTSLPFLQKILQGALETLAMSALGTAIAAVLGLALALPGAGRLGRVLRGVIRLILNMLRSVPELVWAAILLIAAGLGPFAGTLALAAHTTGVLGRLFADTLENVPAHAEQTLRINGAGSVSAFFYATLPQALPQLLSYVFYRWENNIRAAAVLGVVGAGGLGQLLKYHLSLFQMPQAATAILAMLLLVGIVDLISFGCRTALLR